MRRAGVPVQVLGRRVFQLASFVSPINWPAVLVCSARGVPYPNQSNAVRVMEHDPVYGPDRIWYDEFLDRVMVAGFPPREWRDEDDTKVTVDLQDRCGIHGLSSHVVGEAVRYVAHLRPRHVIRDWLNALKWDHEPRIALAFEDYWGAPSDDHTRAASRNFFLSLVARVMKPGCKVDTMCVFEGPQGIKKSSALEVLGGDWYSASHETVGGKDFLQGMRGKWLMEIAELQSFAKADDKAIKNTLSTRNDDYRKSHGRHVKRYPRECVFAGTTNADDWGKDESGLRRYWPVVCAQIQLDLLTAARDQLFAEAVFAFKAGAAWWEMPASTTEIQASRQHYDDWTASVQLYLSEQPPHTGVLIRDILISALKVPLGSCGKAEQMRVSRILKLGGWERRKSRMGNFTHWSWYQGENIGEGGHGGN